MLETYTLARIQNVEHQRIEFQPAMVLSRTLNKGNNKSKLPCRLLFQFLYKTFTLPDFQSGPSMSKKFRRGTKASGQTTSSCYLTIWGGNSHFNYTFQDISGVACNTRLPKTLQYAKRLIRLLGVNTW